MKAIVIEEASGSLHLKDLADPTPQKGEVVIALKAAALNHRDLWIKKGEYAGIRYPLVPGSDGAGVVTACGEGVNPNWQSQEVIINPGYGWGDDERAGSESFKILGLPDQGTLAEKIAVPATQLALKPAHLSFTEAAALPLAGLTAFRALFSRAKLDPREQVLITGAGGGVALFALQFAIANKNKVFVTSGSDEKIEKAVRLGAQGGANYREKNWSEKLKKEAGEFHLIVDSAGGADFDHLLDLTARGGRIVFFGATQGNPPLLNLRKAFWKHLSLLGTTMGSPADFKAMLDFTNKSLLKPVISSTFSLAEAEKAFAEMEKSSQFGKLVVTIS